MNSRKHKVLTRSLRSMTAGGSIDHAASATKESGLGLFGRFFWWCHRNRFELAPFAVAGGLFTSAAAFFKGKAPGVAIFVALGFGGLFWWLVPQRLDRTEERIYARVVIAAAGIWLILASIYGPGHWVMLWALVFGTITLGVIWWYHKLVRPVGSSGGLLSEWRAKWAGIRDRVGLPGSEVVEVTGNEAYAEVTIQLVPGSQSYKQALNAEELIAGALGLPVKAVKIRDLRNTDASKIKLVYRQVTAIDKIIHWSAVEPHAPARLTDPVVLGMSETGEWKKVNALAHWMIIGATRTGKSNALHSLLAQIAGTGEAILFFADLKGGAVASRWAPCVDWMATTLEETERMVNALNRIIEARAAYVTSDTDGDQLTPSREIPAIFLVFDECAAGLGISKGEEMRRIKGRITEAVELIAMRGAAMSVYLILAGQDGSLETFGSERLRGNLTNRLCFRVARRELARYVLNDPSSSEVTTLEPGQFYVHIHKDDPIPVRAPFMTPEENRRLPDEIAASLARAMPKLDELSARAAGRDYETRNDRRPERFQAPKSQEETDMVCETVPLTAEERAEEIIRETGAGVEPPITAEDLARVAGRFDLVGEMNRTVDDLCRMIAESPDGVSPKDLVNETEMSRNWVYDRLYVLRREGLVENPSHGLWRPKPGVTAEKLRAAIDEWESRRRVHAA